MKIGAERNTALKLLKRMKALNCYILTGDTNPNSLTRLTQGVGAVGELLIKSKFVATSWDGF